MAENTLGKLGTNVPYRASERPSPIALSNCGQGDEFRKRGRIRFFRDLGNLFYYMHQRTVWLALSQMQWKVLL